MKKIIFTFGRMNPPTAGHQKLVDKVVSVAKTARADARVYLSHTQNKKKDPLDYNDKIRYAQKAFGSIVTRSPSKTIIQIMQELEKAGYTDLVLVVGSDRVAEFNALLNKYNGKEYTFNSIKVQSAGQRDPDAEGVEGMSASKLRELAKEGDFTQFKAGLPRDLQSMAKAIYDKLRSVMEEIEQLEEARVLNVQQRIKRARTMRRLSRRMARQRKIRKTRLADKPRLERRARKKAIQFLRKRIAGERGQHYADLGTAEKVTIDKLVAKKSGMIAKIAKRLLPKVRKAEMERLKQARTPKTEEVEVTNLQEQADKPKTFKSIFESRPGPSEVQAKQKIARERRQDVFRHDAMLDRARVRDAKLKSRGIRVEAFESLEKKAEAIGVDIDMILNIYDTAAFDPSKEQTEQQQRFAAVNHFVAEARKSGVPKNEETELDEIGPVTLIKYASKAASSAAAARKAGDMATVAKREKGIATAMDKEVASRTAPKPVKKPDDFEKKERTPLGEDGYQWKDFSDTERSDLTRRMDAMGFRHMKNPNTFNSSSLENRKKLADIMRKPQKASDFEPIPRITPAERNVMNNSYIPEEFSKMLEDADRTIDRLRWADVPQMEPLKRMSNNQLKGYVRDYVSKNSDQVRKFMGTADTGMFGRAIIQKMAPNYIPATKGMSDKDWSNAWKAYDNIDPKIKSNLKKGDVSDFQTNSYVREDLQKKNLKSILSKKKEAKSTAGAGEWGTDELVRNYVKDTPHMSISESVDTKKLMLLARLGLVDDVTMFRRVMKKMEDEKTLNPAEREVIYTAFTKFADLVTSDPQTFQKARKAVKEEYELVEAPLVLRKIDMNHQLLKMTQDFINKASDKDLQKLAQMIGKKITIQGKKVVIEAFAEEDLAELSTELLGRYKKKAADDASAADKRGDYKKGNKRFSGIMKATKKQFDNETGE